MTNYLEIPIRLNADYFFWESSEANSAHNHIDLRIIFVDGELRVVGNTSVNAENATRYSRATASIVVGTPITKN